MFLPENNSFTRRKVLLNCVVRGERKKKNSNEMYLMYRVFNKLNKLLLDFNICFKKASASTIFYTGITEYARIWKKVLLSR